MSDSRELRAFHETLRQAGSPFAGTSVNVPVIRREGQEAIRRAAGLWQYRAYLGQARRFKAQRSQSSIDREVLVHARQAVADARAFSSSALRVAGNLHRGGADVRVLETWRDAVEHAGRISCVDAWNQIASSSDLRKTFAEGGVSEDFVSEAAEAIRRLDAHMTVDGALIVIDGSVNGRRVSGSFETGRPPTRPSNVIDLLTRRRFERMLEMFERGEPAHLEGVVVDHPKNLGIPGLTVYAACDTYRELVRHMRKLEDTGLATYQGASPVVLILLGIGLALFIAGAIIAEYCNTATDPHSAACVTSNLLMQLGMVLMIFAPIWGGGHDDSGSQAGLVMGSPVVHGVFKDMESSFAPR